MKAANLLIYILVLGSIALIIYLLTAAPTKKAPATPDAVTERNNKILTVDVTSDHSLQTIGITPVLFQPGVYQYTDRYGSIHYGTATELQSQILFLP